MSPDNTVEFHGVNFIDNILPGTTNPQFSNCNNYKVKLTPEYCNIFKGILNLKENEIKNPNNSINNLWKSNGFCKTFLPLEYNGYGSNYTNFAYLIENLKSNLSFSTLMIVNNLLCAQAINKYGSSSLKLRYLSQIASGEYIGSFCLHETSCGNNIHMMESTGEYCHETKLLKVSARKQWIYNAKSMGFCILFLKTRDINGTEGLSAFFVDKSINSTKIETYPTKNILNIPNVYNVIFDNVTVEAELLGNIGDGFKIAVELQNSARFSIASAFLGISKEALQELSSNIDISPSSYINNKIVEWTSKVFGVETLIYFSTNIADSFPDSCFGIEFASLKIRASETAFEIINGCMEISRKYQQNLDFYMNLLNKIRGLDLFLGSSDVLRLYIGGVSLQRLTETLKLNIDMERNSTRCVASKNAFKVLGLFKDITYIKSNKHMKILELFKDSIKSSIILIASRSIYNLPNEDIFISGLGNAVAILYNLQVILYKFETMSNDNMTDEQIMITERCIDGLIYKLLGAIGKDGNYLYKNHLNVQYNDLSQIVFNNKIHGIEHAITRNW